MEDFELDLKIRIMENRLNNLKFEKEMKIHNKKKQVILKNIELNRAIIKNFDNESNIYLKNFVEKDEKVKKRAESLNNLFLEDKSNLDKFLTIDGFRANIIEIELEAMN